MGHELVDWIAEYLGDVGSHPVLPNVQPGEVLAALPREAPEAPESFDEILRDFDRIVLPATTHWNHPGFFGYFSITGSGPGILGEMITAALNVNAMVWKSGPAATELEYRTLDWLRTLMGLPGDFRGTINDTASSSTLYALVAARERALPEGRTRGLPGGPAARIYTTAEAHSSVTKSIMTLGLGRDGARVVSTGPGRGMDPLALRAAMEEDVAAGIRPVAVVACIGTTSTAAVDPIEAVADVASDFGVWLHIDAAYAGPAALIPEQRAPFAGWERADSIVVNPHKWLFTPIDCSVLYARDPADLRAAFSLTPAYLETNETEVPHLMDHGLALGRRFRALKLWFVMRYFGAVGLRARISNHLALAARFSQWIDEAVGWERWNPTYFSLVVFRCSVGSDVGERNERNRQIMDRVNRAGTVFLSHTELDGEVWLRLAVGNIRTTIQDVEAAWTALQGAARETP